MPLAPHFAATSALPTHLLLPSRNPLHQTSWGRTDGAPEAVGSSVEPDQSLYIKISVQWLTFGFFFLACKVSYNAGCEDESDQCLFCWEGDEEEA